MIEELPDFRVFIWRARSVNTTASASVIRREDGECVATLAGQNYIYFDQALYWEGATAANTFIHQLLAQR